MGDEALEVGRTSDAWLKDVHFVVQTTYQQLLKAGSDMARLTFYNPHIGDTIND